MRTWSGNLIGRAEIPVSAGLGDHGARWIDARAGVKTLVDGALQAKGGAAHVSNGGEAPHERGLSLFCGNEVDITGIRSQRNLHGKRRQHDVVVRVNEAGHEGTSGSVDDFGIRIRTYRRGGDLGNLVSLNEHIGGSTNLLLGTIVDASTMEKN
jgi:hypothetical protein